MASFFDKLNLRPQEQRIVVIVITVVLIIINAVFVWPRFQDWGRLQSAIGKSRATLKVHEEEIARVTQYEAQLRNLEGKGSAVLPAEQALDLTRTVQGQAQTTGIAVTGTHPAPSTGGSNTNQFFDEQLVALDVSGTDKELVDFLVAVGSGNSMIRVRDMDLRPDPPQFRLVGKVTLVASYQKKPKPATPAPAPATPVAMPKPGVVARPDAKPAETPKPDAKAGAPVKPDAKPSTNTVPTVKGKS